MKDSVYNNINKLDLVKVFPDYWKHMVFGLQNLQEFALVCLWKHTSSPEPGISSGDIMALGRELGKKQHREQVHEWVHVVI